MPSLKTDAAQWLANAKEAQLVIKAAEYLRLKAPTEVRALVEWDLVREETGVQTGGVAGGAIGSAEMQEHERCAMEVGASTLGAAVRVNLTFGCAMDDATLGDVGRLKLTFLGVTTPLETWEAWRG
jgi:hypothetical protein